jgi:excisionase family DNA binding protein
MRTLIPELDEVLRALEGERPDLAERLARVADELGREPRDYVSPGEAAEALGVSRNTVKKWVRLGIIRDVWSLPGSGYLKIRRSELERIRADGVPASVAEEGER